MSKQKDILEYLESISSNDSSLKALIQELTDSGTLCLIGGAIRDIVYYQKEPRDIDFVFWGDLDLIISSLSLNAKKNRFGGYKIQFQNEICIDIWKQSDNWAFKNNLLKPTIENMHLGCFFNYDSLIMALHCDYYEDSNFQKFQKDRELDFIFHDDNYIKMNPTSEVNIVRALHIREKHNVSFSNRVWEYINDFKANTGKDCIKKLLKADQEHYHQNSWNETKYRQILSDF